MNIARPWGAALGLALAVAAGCAATAPAAPAAGVEVRRIERLRWDAPKEPDLYRVDFGAGQSALIRQRAASRGSEMDLLHAELAEMELVGERELGARGHCPYGARLVSVVEGTANAPSISAFFRCRGPGIF